MLELQLYQVTRYRKCVTKGSKGNSPGHQGKDSLRPLLPLPCSRGPQHAHASPDGQVAAGLSVQGTLSTSVPTLGGHLPMVTSEPRWNQHCWLRLPTWTACGQPSAKAQEPVGAAAHTLQTCTARANRPPEAEGSRTGHCSVHARHHTCAHTPRMCQGWP